MATRKRSGPGLMNVLILFFNLLAIAAIGLSYLSVHISPERNWLLPFFGLIFPYLLIVNILFAAFWAIRMKWYFLLSLIAILAGWNHTARIYRFGGRQLAANREQAVKLVSYNVKNLSNNNVNLLDTSVRKRILNYLDHAAPDILCLQEFTVIHPDPDTFIDSLSAEFGLPFHGYTKYSEKKHRYLDALFVFSRFPVIRTEKLVRDEEHNFGLICDIDWHGDTVRIFNIHLESVRFRHEDYNFISGLDLQFTEDENIKENSLRIFRKLKLAYSRRAGQVDLTAGLIAQSPYPVILCGDFNDTPNSYTYQELTSNLTDSFVESGRGFGNTYAGKLPSLRIDYILHDPSIMSWEFSREVIELSDHYPVSCLLTKNTR